MSDEDFDELAVALNNLIALNVKTLSKVARLQALVWTLQAQVKAMQINHGADPAALEKEVTAAWEFLDGAAQDEVKDWLVDRNIATPAPDDPWWDKPKA